LNKKWVSNSGCPTEGGVRMRAQAQYARCDKYTILRTALGPQVAHSPLVTVFPERGRYLTRATMSSFDEGLETAQG